MRSPAGSELAPNDPILVTEAAAATGVPLRVIHRLIDENVIPRSARVMVAKRRALRAFALPMVTFSAAAGADLTSRLRRDCLNAIKDYTLKNWSDLLVRPDSANLTLTRGIMTLTLAKPVAVAMADLARLRAAFDRVETNAEIRGGMPVIKGTRVGVHEVASSLRVDGMDAVLADYPSLTRADVEAAALYAAAHPQRGRPAGTPSNRREVSRTVVDLPKAR